MDEKISFYNFSNYQFDSENLVLSKIYQDKFLDNGKYGLTIISSKNGNFVDIKPYLLTNNQIKDYKISDYASQVGLQGYIFSFLYNKLNISIDILNFLCCLLLAIVFIIFCYNIKKKYNIILATIFYITFLLSPWIVSFAKNLYWVEFTWFLPALFGLILSRDLNKSKIYIPLIFITILIKCLCGYEYISTIMLFTISFLLIDFMTMSKSKDKVKILKIIMVTGFSCIFAFFLAISIHGYLKGNGNILEGIKIIYKNDVVRRTISLPGSDNLSGVIKESVNASAFSVIKKYTIFDTNIILGIPGAYFRLLIAITVALLVHSLINKDKNAKKDIFMFLIFLFTTISWFILGRGHSYIHTHMNYVLWYFGFVQICLYIILKSILKGITYVSKNKKYLDEVL